MHSNFSGLVFLASLGSCGTWRVLCSSIGVPSIIFCVRHVYLSTSVFLCFSTLVQAVTVFVVGAALFKVRGCLIDRVSLI